MGLADGYTLVRAGELGTHLTPGDVQPIAEKANTLAMDNSNELYNAFVLSVEHLLGGKRSARGVTKAIAANGKFLR